MRVDRGLGSVEIDEQFGARALLLHAGYDAAERLDIDIDGDRPIRVE